MASKPMRRLALRPHFGLHRRGPSQYVAHSHDRYHLLSGDIFSNLVPLLDGTLDADGIVERLSDSHPPEDVYYALDRIGALGCLTGVDEAVASADPEVIYWSALGTNAGLSRARLDAVQVRIVDLSRNRSACDPLVDALARLGIAVSEQPDAGRLSLTIAVCDDYLDSQLGEIAAPARAPDSFCLVCKPGGTVSWIGPLLLPGGRPCWECLVHRITVNRVSLMGRSQAGCHPSGPPQGILPTSLGLAAEFVATQVANWAATGGASPLVDTVWTLNHATLDWARHDVRARPHCPSCGEPPAHGPFISSLSECQPVHLVSRDKAFAAETGSRACGPEETVERLQWLVSPITGIVPKMIESKVPIPVHLVSCRQVSTPVAAGRPHHRELPLGAGGKGATAMQARAGCIAEAVERFSCGWDGTERRHRARFVDLRDSAVHPDELLGFSDRQYASREAWNEENTHNFFWIPERFDETAEVDWVPSWSLGHSRFRWLPAAFCYYDYPFGSDVAFCRADSNGCASGNVLEEAVLQGLMELVERDAVAIWWYNQLRRPRLQVGALSGAARNYLELVRERYDARGRSFELLDLTHDLGVPVVAATSWRRDGEDRILMGFGAHLDASIAAMRAACELGQTDALFGHIDDPVAGHRRGHASRWFSTATTTTASYTVPDDAAPRAEAKPVTSSRDILDDITAMVRRLRDKGLDVLVVDMTRPDIGFPTARVVVPGLCHFWNRYGRRRLYELPVALGWLSDPNNELSLNPTPFFL